jgi:HSP90 family molecular chaperone
LGVIEDGANKDKILKMCRFMSTKHDVTTLEEYVERMPAWQTSIFFVAGTDMDELKK